jgi:hypothetical protein
MSNTIMSIIAAGLIGILLTIAAGKALKLYRSSRTRPMVLVVTKSGETVRGALLARLPDRVELGGAELLEAGKATPIDGITYIDRNNIRWVQEPTH